MNDLNVEKTNDGVVFNAKIIPASSRTMTSGLLNGMIKIKVSAAPEKGKANKCLIDFLTEKLGVKKKEITIIAGLTNPVKKVQILGISSDTLKKKLLDNKQDRI